jgi:hypothetical protein
VIQGLLQGGLVIGAMIWLWVAMLIGAKVARGELDSPMLQMCAKWGPFGALGWPALLVAGIVHVIREEKKGRDPE